MNIRLLRHNTRVGERLSGPCPIGAPECSKFLRAVATDERTGPDEFIAKGGRLEDVREAPLQAINDDAGRASWYEKAIPRDKLDTRYAGLSKRGHFRRGRKTIGRGYREHTEPSGFRDRLEDRPEI
jgi:hypothetical protein